jgi:membrane protease YdiL (CAAX protease family)
VNAIQGTLATPGPSGKAARRWAVPAGIFALLLVAFWFAAQIFHVAQRIGGHLPSAFVAFALLLAPYWFFGFGLAEPLSRALSPSRTMRVAAPGLLVLPYLAFSLPRAQFQWSFCLAFLAIAIGISALFEFLPPGTLMGWQDVVVLASLGLPVEYHWLSGAFPQGGLAAMPKLLLLDAGLYAYLVVRRLDGIGFDFRLGARDIGVGLREWALFAPIVISLGFALHFITFHRWIPPLKLATAAWLVTFFFVAVPEELFFRGLLQNLLETRVGSIAALLVAAPIFGLSHYNKRAPTFNWRYVLLATLAGIFYGRAWRDRRRLFASGITHATVDVVWGLWFQ